MRRRLRCAGAGVRDGVPVRGGGGARGRGRRMLGRLLCAGRCVRASLRPPRPASAPVLSVSPRLAPSLDLTGAVTLFQALHMCKSDEGVVSTGGAVLDAPKICAAVAACWHGLTSPTQQLACGKAFAARAHQQKYTELQNQPALCTTSSSDSDCRSARCQSPCYFGPCSHKHPPTRTIRSTHTRSNAGWCISRLGPSHDARWVSAAWLCGSSVRIFSRRAGCVI